MVLEEQEIESRCSEQCLQLPINSIQRDGKKLNIY